MSNEIPTSAGNGNGASAVEVLPRLNDVRRTLPTQDWIAKVDKARLDAVEQTQRLAVSHFYQGLARLRDDFGKGLFLPPPKSTLPRVLTGTLLLPDGSFARHIAVSVRPVFEPGRLPMTFPTVAFTDEQGGFALRDLGPVDLDGTTTVTLSFRGANGTEDRGWVMSSLDPNGILGNVRLNLALQPLQESVLGDLRDIVEGLHAAPDPTPKTGTPQNPVQVRLGDDECGLTFNLNVPEERYRYSVLVRLVEPRTSILTETLRFPLDGAGFLPVTVRNRMWLNIPDVVPSFADRVPVDQPISVDGFRDRIVGDVGGVINDAETVPMAGTLGLGYLVQMGQQWSPTGLSLGDLLYSMPLAPGEQQRIAIFEQRQALSTSEFEALDADEQQRQRQQSDSSTQAIFDSAFNESVRGSSSYSTQAESSSWGAAGGIGLALGPIVLGGGAAGGHGSSSSSGNSANALDGARNYTSNAASQAHNSVEREAAARRHAQRTGIRLAIASDLEEVTTKVVTNNNRIHALTMQYWEVLRHYDVSTEIDGVTLVCFVPLQVVRFMPPGVSTQLNESDITTRPALLYRYSQLLKHVDVLRRWLPYQYRPGLAILEEFAGNPRIVPKFDAPPEEIIHVTLTGSFLPFEDVYVTVVTRRGTRVGPVRMSGAIAPLPDKLNDPTHVFATDTDLMAELRRRRAPDQNITLTADLVVPQTVAPDEIVGFELSRSFRGLRYQLAPPKDDPVTQLIATGNFGGLFNFWPVFGTRIEKQINGVYWSPGDLESELGGPSVWGFSAKTSDETYATDFIAENQRFPMAGSYPVAALPVKPIFKFEEVLKIEQTVQHVIRNTITYSRAVWMSLTPEERAIMLEGYTIGVPIDGISDESQHIPLLNCVANQVLGFYGNAMIMPFTIPAELALRMSVDGGGDGNGAGPQQVPFTTGQVQDALTYFHRTGFSPPVSHVAMATHGVLGEAVLGHCASAEKIDVTRFWNWSDSPIPQAADIAGGLLNKGATLVGATAPSTLAGMPAMINNVSAGPTADVAASDALKALIAGKDTSNVPDITGAKELADLVGKTLDTAEKARADALSKAQSLASDGLSKAADIMKANAAAKTAADDANKKAATDAQKATQAKTTTGLADLKANAAQYLGVADSKPDQKSADDYARQILAAKFGTDALSLDVASTLFNDYRKYKSGTSGPYTQGSAAFLKALGLAS